MTPKFQIDFEPRDHTYRLNGQPADGTTDILEAEGMSGCVYYREEHRQRGSAVHKIALLLSHRIRGGSPEEIVANSPWDPAKTSPALVGYGMAVAKFYHKERVRPALVEQPVGSLLWWICGTLDLHGELPNGTRVLVDFKSGQPQPAAVIQTALYAMQLEETFGLKTDLMMVVWVQPDGDYKITAKIPPGGNNLVIGQSAINLYRWRKANGKL